MRRESGAASTDNARAIWKAAPAVLFVTLVTVALLWTCGLPQIRRRDAIRNPAEPQSLDNAHQMGSKTAPAGLIIYSDFECQYCASFAKGTLPRLIRDYVDSGRLLIAFKHFPLETLHPRAFEVAEFVECSSQQLEFWQIHDRLFANLPLPIHASAAGAARAAMCAGEQGKFWEMHDRIYRDQHHLGASDLLSLAEALGLNTKTYEDCAGGLGGARIKPGIALARQLSVSSTPAFFLGTIQTDGRLKVQAVIDGARPLRDFKRALDNLLGSAEGPGSRLGGSSGS
jgi:protein-disulfide isomerase